MSLSRRASTATIISLLLLPTAAWASTVETIGGGPSVGGTPGVNAINVSSDGERLIFADQAIGAVMTPGTGCTAITANRAGCAVAEPGTIIVGLQGQADTFFAASLSETRFFVNGGPGDDQMFLGGAADILAGAGGNDLVNGGPGPDVFQDTAQVLFGTDPGDGNDTFNGEAGEDLFVAGANHTIDGNGKGADTFNGGPGMDTADYSQRTGPLSISVAAGGGDGAPGESDTITEADRVLGGSAADTILTAGGAATLVGGAGGDTLTGGPAADRLYGGTEVDAPGSGDDTLDGGGGPDVLRGGDGKDTASYVTRSGSVIVTLDDAANDGQAGEQDNVRADVERVVGGSAGDTLTGSDGADTLDGGGGPDTLTGGDAADTLNGGEGDDAIEARDGQADTVTCGSGSDTAVADATDIVASDCESVDRPATPDPGTSGGVLPPPVVPTVVVVGAGGPVVLPVTLARGTLKADRRGRVAVTVVCPAQTVVCAGILTLTATKPRRTVGTKPYSVPAGTARKVTFTLSPSMRVKLRRGKLSLRAVATATGTTTTASLIVARRR